MQIPGWLTASCASFSCRVSHRQSTLHHDSCWAPHVQSTCEERGCAELHSAVRGEEEGGRKKGGGGGGEEEGGRRRKGEGGGEGKSDGAKEVVGRCVLSEICTPCTLIEISSIPIFNTSFQYLPGGIVVPEVDEVLHEPSIDLTQRQTLLWGLQYRLGNRHSHNNVWTQS